MTGKVTDASVYSDLGGLTALKRQANAQDPKALREVARQFESVFAKMMLSSMRQASFGNPLFDSQQTEFYQGMFDDQMSLELTKGRGLGLADMLVRQLQHLPGVAAPADDTKAPETGDGTLKMPGTQAEAKEMGVKGKATAFFDVAAPNATQEIALRPRTVGATSAPAGAEGGTAVTPRAPTTSNGASSNSGFDPAKAMEELSRYVDKLRAGNVAANANASSSGTTDTSAGTFRTPTSPEDFIQQLWPCAEAAGKELGINPTHLLAQAALETGWGKSLPCDANGNPSFNFFGIKSTGDWAGNSVSVKTLEFEGGVPVPKQARFRSYDNATDSFRDYVALLRDNPRYAAALNTGNDAKAFATALQRGGYATDPAYAQKIAAIAQNLSSPATALKSAADQPITSQPAPRAEF